MDDLPGVIEISGEKLSKKPPSIPWLAIELKLFFLLHESTINLLTLLSELTKILLE